MSYRRIFFHIDPAHKCLFCTWGNLVHMSIIFFISWIWFPNASHSITTLFVTFTRSPWRLNSISWALKKNFLWGVSRPRSLIEEAGNTSGRGLDLYKWKDESQFFACLYLLFFFSSVRCFLFPALIRALPKWWHIGKRGHFKVHHSLSWFIAVWVCHFNSRKGPFGPPINLLHTLPVPPSETQHWCMSAKGL